MQNEDFRYLGILIATSVVQGGGGLPCLLPSVYNYLAQDKFQEIGLDDVPDLFVRKLLNEVVTIYFVHLVIFQEERWVQFH